MEINRDEQQPHVLIVGTGVGVRTHLRPLTSQVGAQRIGFVSRRPEVARGNLPKDIGYVGSDLRDGVSEWDPELVIVGVPTRFHLQTARLLAGWKGTVLFEKPVGRNRQECLEIGQALRGSKLLVDYQLRGFPAVRAVREMIGRNDIGTIQTITIEEESGASFVLPHDEWFLQPSLGGGQRLQMLTHLADLSNFLFGVLRRNKAPSEVALSPEPQPLVEEWATCEFQIANTAFRLSSRTTSDRRRLAVHVVGSSGRIELAFAEGEGTCTVTTQEGDRRIWAEKTTEKSPFRLAFPFYIQEVIRQTRDGSMPESFVATFADALAVHDLFEAARQGRHPPGN